VVCAAGPRLGRFLLGHRVSPDQLTVGSWASPYIAEHVRSSSCPSSIGLTLFFVIPRVCSPSLLACRSTLNPPHDAD
jgi:hypothetical protein